MLKQFLPCMISDQQSTFVSGQLIQDKSILAQEMFHALSHKKGEKGSFSLKIDMSNGISFFLLSDGLHSVPDGSLGFKNDYPQFLIPSFLKAVLMGL